MFPGGEGAFQAYLRANIVYPDSAIDLGLEGIAYVSFEIDSTGKIGNVKVIKKVPGAPILDREAIRVISAMPDWTPGTMNGKRCKVVMSVPVRFQITIEDADRRKKEIKEQKKAEKKKTK